MVEPSSAAMDQVIGTANPQPTASAVKRQKYSLKQPLGRGAYASVHLVQGEDTGELAVIKRIELQHLDDSMVLRQVNEVEILKSLRHPNIIHHQDAFMDSKQRLNIRMEYAESGALLEKIKSQSMLGVPFSEEQVLSYVVQIGLAIKYCHDRNIIHRDLKPGNIVLTDSGLCKLIDFGMSKAIIEGSLHQTFCGTEAFMAPELHNREAYNHKVDIWAFGGIVYQIMSFKQPFTSKVHQDLGALKAVSKKYKPLRQQYSVPLRNLVAKLLTKDHVNRPDIYEVLNYPVLQPALLRYLKSDLLKRGLATLLNTDAEQAEAFIQLKQTNPDEIMRLALSSPATYDILDPPPEFNRREGLEEYFEHSVRYMIKNLTLQERRVESYEIEPDGVTDDEDEEFKSQQPRLHNANGSTPDPSNPIV